MFTAENKLVTTDLAPQDTVYQMMGIVQRMQKLADRTVLLGEIRADLTQVNPAVASTDIQQLHDNIISEDNIYNSPAEYYAVINNCNIYLHHVDSLLKTHGEYYYEKEVCAAKCFRAWCYLELTKIYGSVPFVTEPVLTADAAEQIVADDSKKKDMGEILNFCIEDLQKYPYMSKNSELLPKYGGQTWNGVGYDKMFIPVRALLAELYLWHGTYTNSEADYINAIRMYHDFFCFPNEERATGDDVVEWFDRDHRVDMDMYSSRYALYSNRSCEYIGVIPCDTVTYYGNTSDLRKVFNSQYSNNYYPWVEPSQRLKDLSAGQDYCKYIYTNASTIDTLMFSKDPNDYEVSRQVGDLRYNAVYQTYSNLSESKYNSSVNDMKIFIAKWTDGSSRLSTDAKNAYVPYFRTTVLYLHLAEALNRAGFPETAYAILKYGLAYDVLRNRDIISEDEFDRLCEIKSYGFSLMEQKDREDEELSAKTNSSFVVWPSTVFDILQKNQSSGASRPQGSAAYLTQIGVHSFGSGDTEYNLKYYLDDEETVAGLNELPTKPVAPKVAVKPSERELEYEEWKVAVKLIDSKATTTKSEYNKYVAARNDSIAYYESYPELYAQFKADSLEYKTLKDENIAYLASPAVRAKRMARVAQLILDEEALEGMFEGLRFYDLMRYQMQENKFNSSSITLPEYIATKYPTVNGSNPWSDNMTGKPWYLKLPKR